VKVRFGHQVAEDPLIIGERQGIVWPDDDDKVVSAGEIVPEQADGFAEESLYAISPHGIADAT
jgi:hypothetical protein